MSFVMQLPQSGYIWTPGHDQVQKVSYSLKPSSRSYMVSKQQLFARIVGGLGGRADVIFGEPDKCIDLSVKHTSET